jgi:8-hydroxy-5-deazaflavin:NADPH oxidoreductase
VIFHSTAGAVPVVEKEMTMNIAILGAGNMARGLTKLFAKAGYGVILGSRNPGAAIALAADFGASVQGGSIADAAAQADTVVLAVPYGAASDVIAEAGGLKGKTVIDISNPLTADYMGLTIGHSTSAAEEIQQLAPGAKVVKAFNTIFAQVLQQDGRVAERMATVFIAGDDKSSNAAVEGIVKQIGMLPVQTGSLKVARYLEPLAGLNIVLGYGLGHGTEIAPAWLLGASAKEA